MGRQTVSMQKKLRMPVRSKTLWDTEICGCCIPIMES